MPTRAEPSGDAGGWGRAAAACGIGAAALACLTPLVGAALRPGYRHAAQYISELGEVGAPHASLVNLGGFLPTGLLVLLFVGLSATRPALPVGARAGLLLFSAVGVGYLVSSLFPCQPGCPSAGPLSQQLHNASGLVEYAGGGLALLLLGASWPRGGSGRAVRCVGLAGSAVVFAALAGMLAPALGPPRGVSQRAAEAALFLGVLSVSFNLWRTGASEPLDPKGTAGAPAR